MPTRLFRRDARTRDVSVEVVYELMSQDMYEYDPGLFMNLRVEGKVGD